MSDPEPDRPTTNQPLHGERRSSKPAVLAVLGLVVVIAVVFLLITWLRWNAG